MKRRISGVAAICALALTGILPTASASDLDGTIVGGWSEGSGYFVGSSATPENGEIMPAAAPGKVRHTGRSERTTIRGTTHKRSHGWTTWRNVYHYTTARLEHQAPYSGVITTSQRQWGWHGTEAKTKWTAFNPNLPSGGVGRARTYYGK